MAIRGLKQDAITRFLGKKTTVNLSATEPGTLHAAKNVMILSDGKLRRAPGYTLVGKVGNGPFKAGYDFQRDVDNKQFVFVQSGSEIYYMNADGTGKTLISTGEVGTHQFVCNSFIAYSSDGTNAWRYVDKAGTLTKYKWGISKPASAPTVGLSAGTLTLTYGRTYVYCYVSKYTDSLGIQRVSISAPSPISAHTGPLNSQVATLGSISASSDAQVNYIWIFATSDSPYNTSATYYFAAEIANGTTSWGDTLADSALDETRLAPFDNNPAPPAPILNEFQNRIQAINGSLMQLSGFDEITLGIPEEAWPASLFFNIPSGKRTVSGAVTMAAGTLLAVGTQDYWYDYTGYNASTFTEQDRVSSPGPAGPRSFVMTPMGLMFLASNQSLRVWKGSGESTSISDDLSKKLYGTYSMEDIDPDYIADSVLQWYDFGPMSLLIVLARTADSASTGFNLMQLWSFTVQAQESSGIYGNGSSVYGQLTGVYQTDKLPSVNMTGAFTVNVGFQGQRYIFLGDASGNVYRWPDGFLDNGNPYQGVASLAWALPNEGKSRFFWMDVTTERTDSATAFQLYARVADAPDQQIVPTQLAVQQLPSPVNQTSLTIRGSMNVQKVATGKYVAGYIVFPQDNAEAAVSKVLLASKAINAGIA